MSYKFTFIYKVLYEKKFIEIMHTLSKSNVILKEYFKHLCEEEYFKNLYFRKLM